jgi:hypothetical protein
MSKTKMKCITCGKWFQSANAKDVTCPDCTQKARKEKMAAKAMPPTANAGKPEGQTNAGTPASTRSVPPAPKPKPAASGTNQWLDSLDDVRVAQPDQQPKPRIPTFPAPRDRGGQDRGPGGYRDERSQSSPGGYRDRDRDREHDHGPGGPGGYRDERIPGGYRDRDRGQGGYRDERGNSGYRGPGGYRDNDYRGGGYRVGGGMGLPNTGGPRPRKPMGPGTGYRDRGPRPGPGGPGERMDRQRRGPGGKPVGQKPKKPAAPPRPKREKIPPPQPFKPTEEQIAQVEARYLELAVPTEFDGIRTQIAQELNIPKSGVKKIVKDLRDKMSLPSWWELQTYKGSAEEMEKIREIYLPFLPLPPVGVHKQIAEQLEVKPTEVYQAIKTIRLEMNLPQFNDPALHGIELRPHKAKEEQATESVGAGLASALVDPVTLAPADADTEAEKPVEGQPSHAERPADTATEAEKSVEAHNSHDDRSIEIAEEETGLTFEKVGNTTKIMTTAADNQADGE